MSHRAGPIFVVGYMHSGTTLLLNVLRNHPDLYCPDHETKYFMHTDLVRRHAAAMPGDPRIAAVAFAHRVIEEGFPLIDPGPARPSRPSAIELGNAFRHAMDQATAARGRRRWVEKTPGHVFHVDEIAAVIGDALFVEVVRDPRDVLASKKTRRDTVWSSDRYAPEVRARKQLEKAFDPLWDSLSWLTAIRAGERGGRSRGDRWMRLRYEDLVADPEASVSELCAFVGVSYRPELLDVERGIPADPGELDSAGGGVVQGSVLRWPHVLDPVEVAICERVTQEAMRQLAYALTGTAGRPAMLARIVRQSLPELGIRAYHRWRLGGRAYAWDVVRSYAKRFRVLRSSDDRGSK